MAASSPRPRSAPRKPVTTSKGTDLFEYTTESGQDISLPRFDSVKPGVIRKIRKLSDVDQFFTVLETLADAETLAVIDDMEQGEFQALQEAWFKHSGVELGES